MKNSQCTVVVRSECGETRGHCGSNFQAGGGGGGIIKRVPSLDFPYGSVAPPSHPQCFSIKLKVLRRASATESNPAAREKLKVCQSIIPLVTNFGEGGLCLSCVITSSGRGPG